MPFNCKYAIFDNDGTLMESMYYWRLAGAGIHDRPPPAHPRGDDAARRCFPIPAAPFPRTLPRYVPGVSYRGASWREMEERMGRHYRYDVVEKPGVGEFLAALQRGAARACAWPPPRRGRCARVALERLGMRPVFRVRHRQLRGRHAQETIPHYFPHRRRAASGLRAGRVLGVRGRAARHAGREGRRHARVRHRRLHRRASARGHPFHRRRLHKPTTASRRACCGPQAERSEN